MPNAKFYLKNLKEEESTIRLFFNYSGNVFKYSTKLSCKQNQWDKKRHRLKSQAKGCAEINKILNNIEETILDIYNKLLVSKSYVNNNVLREKLDIELGRTNKENFFEYTLHYINSKEELARSTKRDYKQCYNSIKEFQKHSKYIVTFDSINLNFYEKFKSYTLTTKRQAKNTFGKRIKFIKSVMNYATELGVNTNLEYQKKRFKVLEEKKKHQYLSIDEVNQLKDVILEGKEDKARDVFLLFCYLGIRYGDYKQITRNNMSIKEGVYHLDILMNKVKNPISIPLDNNTIEILKKWGYKLPYISNSDVNKYIKKACLKAGIDEAVMEGETVKKKYQLISCHTGRRSFATNGYISNVPIRTLMSITGHKKESSFYNYVQIKRNTELIQILSIYPNQLRKVS